MKTVNVPIGEKGKIFNKKYAKLKQELKLSIDTEKQIQGDYEAVNSELIKAEDKNEILDKALDDAVGVICAAIDCKKCPVKGNEFPGECKEALKLNFLKEAKGD